MWGGGNWLFYKKELVLFRKKHGSFSKKKWFFSLNLVLLQKRTGSFSKKTWFFFQKKVVLFIKSGSSSLKQSLTISKYFVILLPISTVGDNSSVISIFAFNFTKIDWKLIKINGNCFE